MKQAVLVVAFAVGAGVAAASKGADCEAALRPAYAKDGGERRPVRAGDLIGLRDIGLPDAAAELAASPFAMAPSGREIAFILRRARVTENDYCIGIAILPLRGGPPRIRSIGGVLGSMTTTKGGISGVPTGAPAQQRPSWSPDGTHLAFIRHDVSGSQVWTIRRDGRALRPVRHLVGDIVQVDWASSRRLVIALASDRAVERAARDREAKLGYRYDARWIPKVSAVPFLIGRPSLRYVTMATDGTGLKPASETLRTRLQRAQAAGPVDQNWSDGMQAGLVPDDPARFASSSRLHVMTASGHDIACDGDSGRNVVGAIWVAHDRLAFLRREGPAGSQLALYDWRPGKAPPARRLVTDALLSGCIGDAGALICAWEDATHPRRVVRIDPHDSSLHRLWNPNPEFDRATVGPVRRLIWSNARGATTFGDLVLPPGHKAGERHPLVLVGYGSRGFLRGGTGDEYPIQLFAAHGYAVLSYQRPRDVAFETNARDAAAFERANRANLADRRSVASALEQGIVSADRLGVIDPARVALTGFSDGAASVFFALAQGMPLRAALVSSCCEDPGTLLPLAGPGLADVYRRMGYPGVTDPDNGYYGSYSIARNAAKVRTPLLMQLPQDEYLAALETFEALREVDKPVELYVFPGEHHVKTQPAHRVAIYERSLAWLDRWLRP